VGYNRKNKLKYMQEVVDLYCREKKPGISTFYVYVTFIRPRYHISLRTLYNYMTVPINRELKAEEEKHCACRR
jgi:hypothetical protein